MHYSTRLLAGISLALWLTISAFAQSAAPWPTAGWRTATPESQGVDSAVFAEAITQARAKGHNIHSLLIVRNGYLIAESYFFPYDGKSPHDIASVTKGITSTLIGQAVAQGKIKSVNEPFLSFFKDRKFANADARKEHITVEHLLTMSSGLDCAGRGEPKLWGMLDAKDDVQYMLDLPVTAEPGSTYGYCSGGMHLLSAILTKATGESAETFARKNLFAPLGITTLKWPRDPQGINHGFGNLHLLPRDMAKLGWLMLNQGQWNGKQVVSAAWFKAMTTGHIKTGGAGSSDYGYGWRVPPAGNAVAFEASGRGGQQISVLPSKNAVIVFNGGGFGSGETMKLLLSAFKSDQALPANAAALAQLNEAIRQAAQASPQAEPKALPALAQTISGKTFELEPNWMGLKNISLNFGANAMAATLQFGYALKQAQWGMSAKARGAQTISETRPIGWDGALRFSPNGILGAPVGLRGMWEDAQTFVLEYDELSSTNGYRLQLRFEEKGVLMQAKERTGLFDEKFTGKIMAKSK